jgi:hypothetical protein
MDVHPTKNVSIGIDPYPSVPLKMCFFPWSMDSTAFGRWRPQQRSKWPRIARSKPAIRKVEHHNVRCSAFFLFSCIYLCTHIYIYDYICIYVHKYVYIYIFTHRMVSCYTAIHITHRHTIVWCQQPWRYTQSWTNWGTNRGIFDNTDDQKKLLAKCSVWNLDMFMMFASYQPETFHTSARLQTSHARRH